MKFIALTMLLFAIFIVFVPFFFIPQSILINNNPQYVEEIENIFINILFGFFGFLVGLAFFLNDKFDIINPYKSIKYWYIIWPLLSIGGIIYIIFWIQQLNKLY